jgi:hypothetical protein
MAYLKNNGRSHYLLRESCIIADALTFRDVFDLGTDPSEFIHYPGGNAFYLDEQMEAAVAERVVDYDTDELEDLFWPWIRPDIKRAVETFRNRSFKSTSPKLTAREKQDLAARIHTFDKRRTLYLKFGNMDQGPLENMPATLFKDHDLRSRDEIEHAFVKQEFALKAHELKSYVYTVFDLHRFFSGFMAKKMPHALDQEKVDDFFLKEICRLNKELFNKETQLDDHMIRYMIMFFDHQYANTTLLDDFARDFMARHRFFTPRPEKSITIRNACTIFNITKKELATMTRQHLTKLYRGFARQVHPDTGGSHEKFVELNNAYEVLLETVK